MIYKTDNSRVYGNGQSYNVTNRITAEQLCNTLNTYQQTISLYQNIGEQLDKITKQIIQANMSLKILESDINKIKEILNEEDNH